MNHLVYCVFRRPEHQPPGVPTGVGGQPVFLVDEQGLTAAASILTEPDSVTSMEDVLAYERVVEWFSNFSTAIPLRYGSLFENRVRIACMLAEYKSQFDKLLTRLDGCVEMGLRVSTGSFEMPEPAPPDRCATGLEYLLSRRSQYESRDRILQRSKDCIDEFRTGLTGLFVESRQESRPETAAAYFLVSRTAVDDFRRRVRELQSTVSTKISLSGPWPPYNFVECQPL